VENLVEKVEEAFIKRQALEEKVRTILSDKLAALGKMAAGIGHEINNPLAVIYQILSRLITVPILHIINHHSHKKPINLDSIKNSENF